MDASDLTFDKAAQLVAQAEHVPVHLGSMLRSVEATIASVGAVEAGDVVIVNDPFTGGSHLPDITLVAPIYVEARHIGDVATRAHHADVGGMEPSSMPGNSREIYNRRVVIPAVKLYRRRELQEDAPRLILANVRTPIERRGDLKAQLAALRVGEQRLGELALRYGADLVTAGFAAILDYAERRMRRRLAELPPGTYRGEDFLDDDGSSEEPVRVALAITVSPERLVLDFAGSSAQRPGNIGLADDLFGGVLRGQDPRRSGNPGERRHLSQRRAEDPGGQLSRRGRPPRCAPAIPRRLSASPIPC